MIDSKLKSHILMGAGLKQFDMSAVTVWKMHLCSQIWILKLTVSLRKKEEAVQIIKHLCLGNYLKLIKTTHFGCILASLFIKSESCVNYPDFTFVLQMFIVCLRNKRSNVPNYTVQSHLLVCGVRKKRGKRQ